MTYCVAIMLDTGLIFASDSRTHAEVDNFARFCKMTLFERAGDRVVAYCKDMMVREDVKDDIRLCR